jgi:hypothetical protein
VLTGYIHNDPNGCLSGIFAALSRVPREASMPRAAAVRRHLSRDPAGIGTIGGEDIDAGLLPANVTACPPRLWICAAAHISLARASC